ncbi:MAG: S24/S26 family peptidase [Clostridia bacterium]|nr:S24/S26 family peptidase [Clostridia bacterium]
MMEEVTLLEALSKHGVAVVQGRGTSMLPLIANTRDRICIRPLKREPRKHDILVYSAHGTIVVHRALKICGDEITVCGDSQITPEIIHKNSVIAYAPELIRRGKYIDLERSVRYKLYSGLWCANLFLRRCMLFVLRRVSPTFKREMKAWHK